MSAESDTVMLRRLMDFYILLESRGRCRSASRRHNTRQIHIESTSFRITDEVKWCARAAYC